ncbi:MAG: sulfatase-like hydrolase/transferase [Rhodobiaceae bacterium]|nr:sulfatase-like hydrolase/transferase [Rhodobiaceae bacterium]
MLKKVFGGVGAALLVLIAVGWVYRVELALNAPGVLLNLVNPVGPNQEIVWTKGPDVAEAPPSERPPNIIFIVTDDMGFNDISFYGGGASGSDMQTPHIDALAHEGVAFTNGYAGTAVCAPSRAMIMTGRYATRFGFKFTPTPPGMLSLVNFVSQNSGIERPHPSMVFDRDVEIPSYDNLGMPTSEITVAEMLKEAGYYTAHIGKWHIGRSNGSSAIEQGFDDSLLMASGLYLPEDHPDVVNSYQDFDPIDRFLWPNMQYASTFNNGERFEPRGYITDYYTDEAVKVIENNRNQPFFLYLAHWGIHTPLQALKSDYDALSHIEDHRLRVYTAMTRAVDRSVGRVMQALKDNGLDENTLVIFTSDNGGAGYVGLDDLNTPYRGWKITLFEGGTHVPFMARWPKRIPAGTVFDEPVSHIDMFATAAGAAGGAMPTDRIMDGVDFVPFVAGETEGAPHEALFWTAGEYRSVLKDGWKLQVSGLQDKEWLFHLADDPSETTNLADAEPAKLDELRSLLDAHQAEQAEPIWPSSVATPVYVDKTLAEPLKEDDEVIYWEN